MVKQRMDENWSRVKTQVRALWGDQFDDAEMKKARGNLKKMVNLIETKTGESRSEILQKMSAII